MLTSSLFFMHGPYDVPSFFYYLLGGLLLGFAYKRAKIYGFLLCPYVLQQFAIFTISKNMKR